MTKRKPRPEPQADALLDVDLQPTGTARPRGRVERRVEAAVRKLRADGALRDIDAPLIGAELALAETIDAAARKKAPGWEYAVQGSARELLKIHQALAGAKPAEDNSAGAAVRDLLTGLANPE